MTVAIPSLELVPFKTPWAKVSESIPFEIVILGGLLKSTVDCGVNEPNVVSAPSPVKF